MHQQSVNLKVDPGFSLIFIGCWVSENVEARNLKTHQVPQYFLVSVSWVNFEL